MSFYEADGVCYILQQIVDFLGVSVGVYTAIKSNDVIKRYIAGISSTAVSQEKGLMACEKA